MRIAIYGSKRQEPALEPIAEFMRRLAAAGVDTVMHAKLYRYLSTRMPQTVVHVTEVVEDDIFEADLAVSLGGDGTMLRTTVWVGEKGIPIIGFNTGHLGFLTAQGVEHLPGLLDDLAADAYRLEKRTLLKVSHPELPHWCPCYALNEITVGKVESSSMITADVSVDGCHLAEYRADGLIVCTATGSTAYNLSVGGPIVQPTMDVCVLSPVAAHSLSMRPMVIDASSTIEIGLQARASHVRLSLDSRSLEIPTGTRVKVGRAPFEVKLLQAARNTFADKLRDKLHWGET